MSHTKLAFRPGYRRVSKVQPDETAATVTHKMDGFEAMQMPDGFIWERLQKGSGEWSRWLPVVDGSGDQRTSWGRYLKEIAA